jgi:hypothetical protein
VVREQVQSLPEANRAQIFVGTAVAFYPAVTTKRHREDGQGRTGKVFVDWSYWCDCDLPWQFVGFRA